MKHQTFDDVFNARSLHSKLKTSDYLSHVFNLLNFARAMGQAAFPDDPLAMLHTAPNKSDAICIRAFFGIHGIGSRAYYKMLDQLDAGAGQPDTENRGKGESRTATKADFVHRFLTLWVLDNSSVASLGRSFDRVLSFRAKHSDIHLDLEIAWKDEGCEGKVPSIGLMRKVYRRYFKRVQVPAKGTLGHCGACEVLRVKIWDSKKKGNHEEANKNRERLALHKLHYQEEVKRQRQVQVESSDDDAAFLCSSIDYTDTIMLPHSPTVRKEFDSERKGFGIKVAVALHWATSKKEPHTVVYLHSEHANPKGVDTVSTMHYHMVHTLKTRSGRLQRRNAHKWVLQADGGGENVQLDALASLCCFCGSEGWLTQVELSRLVPSHTKNLNDQRFR